jgi:aspartate/methionine/tyrosine aminotransferase
MMMQEFLERRDLITAGLNALDGVSCIKPGGAFYVFPNIRETGFTDVEFCDFMLETAGIACAPGSIFGEGYSDYVRFCYAASKDDIKDACARMSEALRHRS